MNKALVVMAFLILLLYGCSSGSAETATTATSAVTTTAILTTTEPTPTSTQATTTTLSIRAQVVLWSLRFESVAADYNKEFGLPYQNHVNNYEYTEAALDCVTASTHLKDWREHLLPAPDDELGALVDAWMASLSKGFDLCEGAGTIGDWRKVNSQLESSLAATGRINERIDELKSGG